MPQLSKTESSRSVTGAPPSLPGASARGRASTARVLVRWSAANDGGTPSLESIQIELEAELETPAPTTWSCRQAPGTGWVEALSAARCSEVVLTALDDDLPSKHLILELAGLLTLKLARTQPLIRVRFLPSSERAAPRARRH